VGVVTLREWEGLLLGMRERDRLGKGERVGNGVLTDRDGSGLASRKSLSAR